MSSEPIPNALNIRLYAERACDKDTKQEGVPSMGSLSAPDDSEMIAQLLQLNKDALHRGLESAKVNGMNIVLEALKDQIRFNNWCGDNFGMTGWDRRIWDVNSIVEYVEHVIAEEAKSGE